MSYCQSLRLSSSVSEPTYLNGDGTSDDTIDRRFGKWVEASVLSSHEIRLQEIAIARIVLEDAQIELHAKICDMR